MIFLKSNVTFCLYLNNIIRSEIFIKILLNFLHKILDKDLMITNLSTSIELYKNYLMLKLKTKKLLLKYYVFRRKKTLKALRKKKKSWFRISKRLFELSLFFLKPYNLNKLKSKIKNFILCFNLVKLYIFKKNNDNSNNLFEILNHDFFFFLNAFKVFFLLNT